MKTLLRNTILQGDARTVLPTLPPESVDCCITSPPYANGLRRYSDSADELGQEPTVTAYIENVRAVMRGVRHLLKDSGSAFVVIGDSYATHPRQGAPRGSLLLAPQRLALALSADGWWVRNVICWAKPNPLPQSAKDRFSPTYESVLFVTKTRRYHFGLDSVRVPHRSADRAGRPRRAEVGRKYQGNNTGLGKLKAAGQVGAAAGKNPGDVWTIPTAKDRTGHQATFPEALIERPVLAACPERICVQCDRAWTRPTRIIRRRTSEGVIQVRKTGELRRCDCFAPSRPGVVLDPFFGTGTVGVVANRLGRDFVGIELNPRFITQAHRRIGTARKQGADLER